ncbi:MAG: hypothetical protein K6B70_01915 [Clostridia bacterium]|nr:hypothetical protein [Clostridia bacterium]
MENNKIGRIKDLLNEYENTLALAAAQMVDKVFDDVYTRISEYPLRYAKSKKAFIRFITTKKDLADWNGVITSDCYDDSLEPYVYDEEDTISENNSFIIQILVKEFEKNGCECKVSTVPTEYDKNLSAKQLMVIMNLS